MNKGLVPLRGTVIGEKSQRIQDDALKVSHKAKTVLLGSGKVLEYDYCIVAVGAQNASPCEPPAGLNTLEGIRAHFEAINAAIRASSKVVVVGGGAVGMEVAGAVRDAVSHATVAVVHSGKAPVDVSLPGTDPALLTKFQERLVSLSGQAKIDLHLGTRVANLTASDCPGGFKHDPAGNIKVELKNGTTLTADLVLWCVGTRSNAPELMSPELLEERSMLIKVDKHCAVEGAEGLFAVGDCNNFKEPKLATTARSKVDGPPGVPDGQVDVILANLLCLAEGRPMEHAWTGPEKVASLVPLTRKAGGAAIGAPNFLSGFKAGVFEYFAAFSWTGLGAGKFGKSPVTLAEVVPVKPRPRRDIRPEVAEAEAAAAEAAAAQRAAEAKTMAAKGLDEKEADSLVKATMATTEGAERTA